MSNVYHLKLSIAQVLLIKMLLCKLESVVTDIFKKSCNSIVKTAILHEKILL